jgi:hypothetical protein
MATFRCGLYAMAVDGRHMILIMFSNVKRFIKCCPAYDDACQRTFEISFLLLALVCPVPATFLTSCMFRKLGKARGTSDERQRTPAAALRPLREGESVSQSPRLVSQSSEYGSQSSEYHSQSSEYQVVSQSSRQSSVWMNRSGGGTEAYGEG